MPAAFCQDFHSVKLFVPSNIFAEIAASDQALHLSHPIVPVISEPDGMQSGKN